MRNLTNAELAQILDKDIFHEISEAADALSVECYVVGGYVRDLFLERLPMTSMSWWWGAELRWLLPSRRSWARRHIFRCSEFERTG